MTLTVLVGGKKRDAVLAQRRQELEALAESQGGNPASTSLPLGVPLNQVRVQEKAARVLVFNEGIRTLPQLAGGWNRFLLPSEAYSLIANGEFGSLDKDLTAVYHDLIQGPEWLDLWMETTMNAINVYKYPRGIVGEGTQEGIRYCKTNMSFAEGRLFPRPSLPVGLDTPLLKINNDTPSLFDYLIRFPPVETPTLAKWHLRIPAIATGGPLTIGYNTSTDTFLLSVGTYAGARGVADPHYKPEGQK